MYTDVHTIYDDMCNKIIKIPAFLSHLLFNVSRRSQCVSKIIKRK